jgi:ribonuclease R
MLPEVLSNFACSLRPNEENILFSYFEITDKCEVVDQWFGRTVIYSDQRFMKKHSIS